MKKIKAWIPIPKNANGLDFNWYGLEMFSDRKWAKTEKVISQKIIEVEITFPASKKKSK